MRGLLAFLNLLFTTFFLSIFALLVSFFDRKGNFIHRIARLWAKIHLKICGIGVELDGLQNIKKPPYIFMSNHSSALDIFVLLSSLPLEFKWVAKRELFWIPFFGWALKKAGYIGLDRKNPKRAISALKEAVERVKEGFSLVVFPEGTRSFDGRLLPFKRGGFRLALETKAHILPVAIIGTAKLLPRGSLIPKGKGVVLIKFGEPLEVKKEDRAQLRTLMEETREKIEALLWERR